MHAGRLNRRVTLQARTLSAADAYGEKTATFTELATVWGERVDTSRREFFAAGQKHAEATAIFRIRYRSDLTAIHRIVCEGVTYDVLTPAEIGLREGLELQCKAVA